MSAPGTRRSPVLPLVLAGAALSLLGLMFVAPPGQKAEAAGGPVQPAAGLRAGASVTLAYVVPARTDARLTVELVRAGGKVLHRHAEKVVAGDAAVCHSVQFSVGKGELEGVIVRTRLDDGAPHDVKLSALLLARGHETTLAASQELFAGSMASLRCEVRGVRSVAETVPLPGARVTILLTPAGKKAMTLYEGLTGAAGVAEPRFLVPELPTGSYRMQVVTKSPLGEETLEREVKLKAVPRVLLTTDKPLYQPGQTIHLRALALRAFDLKPSAHSPLVLEVEDARGNKVFKKELKTTEHGLGFADFALADEVNQGDYRIRAVMGDYQAEKTVTVKPYVLPKFKTAFKTDKPFYLPKETVKGEIQADYFFGKPVAKGKLKVTASTFDVAFKEFATWEGTTDETGAAKFEVKLPDYFVGLPLQKGNAIVRLEVKLTDTADHAETVSKTCPVSEQALKVSLIPEAGRLIPGMENRVFAAALYPDGSPAKGATVALWVGKEAKGKPVAEVKTNETGLAEFTHTPTAGQFRQGAWGQRPVEMLGGVVQMGWQPSSLCDLTARAKDARGDTVTTTVELSTEPTGENVLLRLDRALYQGGEPVQVDVRTSAGLPTVYLDVIKNGQVMLSKWLEVKDGKASHRLDLPAGAFGTLEVHAYQMIRGGEIIRDSRIVYASPPGDLRIRATADKETYLPGGKGVIQFEVTDAAGKPAPAALGVLVVDEAVYALQDMQPGMEKVYFTLQEELLKPAAQAVYKPGENLDSLIRRPAPDENQQQAARVLLTAVRPKVPGKWQVDPAAQRRQQADVIVQHVAQALLNHAQSQKSVLVVEKGTGRVKYVEGLLEKLTAARTIHPPILQDPIAGRPLTLDEVIRLDPGVGPERFGGALTQIRLVNLAHRVIQLANGSRPAWQRDGKWTLPAELVLVAGENLGGKGSFHHLDAWGNPLRVAAREPGQVQFASADVFKDHTLVSAGADGKFGTGDDVVLGGQEPWQLQQAWWRDDSDIRTKDIVRFRQFDRRGGAGMFPPMPGGMPGGMGGGGGLPRPVAVQAAGALPPMAAPGRPTSAPKPDSGGAPGDGPAPAEPTRVRDYFPETLLWQPSLITDERGRASLEVPFADSITTWRLSASASSKGGSLGSATLPLRVFQEFFVDIDLPVALTQNDEVAFPVAVYNYLKGPQTVTLQLDEDRSFELVDGLGLTRKVDLKAGEVTSVKFRIRAKKVGTMALTVNARGTTRSDAVKRSVQVLPDGVPVEQVYNGQLEGTLKHPVTLPDDAIAGSERLFVKVYPGVMAQVVEGLDGMLRMPTGCFEQTSSSAYPNILIVDYLRKSRGGSPALMMRAETYLNAGYQRLLTFERPGGGFDWWGSGPPLVWLSAYGLQEFNDMARVWPIDRGVIDRTRAWLLKQQGADGTWSNIGATHGESIERMGDPKLLLTSYVVWAVLDSATRDEAWRKSDEYGRLKKAIEYIRAEAPKADNSYILALAANALASWDAKDDSTHDVLKRVLTRLDGKKEHRAELKAACFPAGGQSLAYAREDGLTVETTALAVLAMVKNGQFSGSVNEALAYLVKTKGSQGHWGSTQATILALKALLAASAAPEIKDSIPYTVHVNGKQVAEGSVTAKNFDVMQQFDLRQHLKSGPNEVSLQAAGKTGLMYQVAARHYTPRPRNEEVRQPLLQVDVEYDRTKLSTADLLKAKATFRYNAKEPTYMVIVDLPIPPGFVVDPGEFADMVGNKKVQKFSVTSRQVTLYLGDVKARSVQTFEYALRPKYPVKAKSPAAVVYEYNTPANRAESKPVELVVDEKK